MAQRMRRQVTHGLLGEEGEQTAPLGGLGSLVCGAGGRIASSPHSLLLALWWCQYGFELSAQGAV